LAATGISALGDSVPAFEPRGRCSGAGLVSHRRDLMGLPGWDDALWGGRRLSKRSWDGVAVVAWLSSSLLALVAVFWDCKFTWGLKP